MGFPVSDQVDLVLPLLGLETMLGASMMANTTAAEDDDDGPHQPKPCSGGEQVLATAREPHPNPGNPMKVMEKIIGKPGSEPHTTLKCRNTCCARRLRHGPACVGDCYSGSLDRIK